MISKMLKGLFVAAAFGLLFTGLGSTVPTSLADQHTSLVNVTIDPVTGTVTDNNALGANFGRSPNSRFNQGVFEPEDLHDEFLRIDIEEPETGATPPGGIFPITMTFENIGDRTFTSLTFVIEKLVYKNGSTPPPFVNNADRLGPLGPEIDVDFPSPGLGSEDVFQITFDVVLPEILKFVLTTDPFLMPRIDIEKFISSPPVPSGDVCEARPRFLVMTYVGGNILTQDQPDKNGNPKASVDEGSPVLGFPAQVRILARGKKDGDGGIFFEGEVGINETFTMENASARSDGLLHSDTLVEIFFLGETLPVQTIIFHTSCSKLLELDNQFGGIQVAGWLDKDGNSVGLPNSEEAEDPPVVELNEGDVVTWTYVVTNTGDVPLSNITVTDSIDDIDPDAVINGGLNNVGDINDDGQLDRGEEWLFTASGTVQEGLNCNTGRVTGTGPTGSEVMDEDEACYTGVVVPCGVCKGGVTELTLRNNLGVAARIKVVQKNGDIVFDDDVGIGATFSFFGTEKDGKLGTEITVFVGGVEHVKIHTSCSKIIGPGLVFGDFEVVEGKSKDNGPICPLFGACDAQPAGSLEFSKNKAKWEISNNGTTYLVVESVELSWPAENGQLKKMKLNHDFWTGLVVSPAPGATTTILESEFKAELKRRTIKPGETRRFELEFEHKPSKNQGDYFIKVVFIGEGGCEISFVPSPPGSVNLCTTKVQSMTLRYDGPAALDNLLGVTVVFDPDKGPDVVFPNIDLVNDVTELIVDATAGGEVEFGAKTGIRILDSSGALVLEEIIHTSCSADFVAGQAAPLDGNTPSPPNSTKGDPSPTWFVVSFTQKP